MTKLVEQLLLFESLVEEACRVIEEKRRRQKRIIEELESELEQESKKNRWLRKSKQSMRGD
jgi:hypothetical protein